MARKVPEEMVQHLTESSSHNRRKYEWEKYADGDWWELRQGTDYTAKTVSVRAALSKWAAREGYKSQVRVLKEGEGFMLRITPA